jgi:hypothetical protein
LDKLEERVGPEGRALFEKFLREGEPAAGAGSLASQRWMMLGPKRSGEPITTHSPMVFALADDVIE